MGCSSGVLWEHTNQESQDTLSVTLPTHLLGSARGRSPNLCEQMHTVHVGCKIRLARVSCLPWEDKWGTVSPSTICLRGPLALFRPHWAGVSSWSPLLCSEGVPGRLWRAGSRGTSDHGQEQCLPGGQEVLAFLPAS